MSPCHRRRVLSCCARAATRQRHPGKGERYSADGYACNYRFHGSLLSWFSTRPNSPPHLDGVFCKPVVDIFIPPKRYKWPVQARRRLAGRGFLPNDPDDLGGKSNRRHVAHELAAARAGRPSTTAHVRMRGAGSRDDPRSGDRRIHMSGGLRRLAWASAARPQAIHACHELPLQRYRIPAAYDTHRVPCVFVTSGCNTSLLAFDCLLIEDSFSFVVRFPAIKVYLTLHARR